MGGPMHWRVQARLSGRQPDVAGLGMAERRRPQTAALAAGGGPRARPCMRLVLQAQPGRCHWRARVRLTQDTQQAGESSRG